MPLRITLALICGPALLVHAQGLWLSERDAVCYVQFAYRCDGVSRMQCDRLAEARGVKLNMVPLQEAEQLPTGCSIQPQTVNWNAHFSTMSCTSEKMCVCTCSFHPSS